MINVLVFFFFYMEFHEKQKTNSFHSVYVFHQLRTGNNQNGSPVKPGMIFLISRSKNLRKTLYIRKL